MFSLKYILISWKVNINPVLNFIGKALVLHQYITTVVYSCLSVVILNQLVNY